jgi:hypothetical protein
LAAGHVGHQSPPDLQDRKLGVGRDDAHVSAEGDLQSAAERVALDRGDHRHGQLAPHVHRPLPGGPGRPVARGQRHGGAGPLAAGQLVERRRIQARAEVGAGARQHDRPDAAMAAQRGSGRHQRLEHRRIEGVALLRPVQPHLGHAVGHG